MYKVDMTKIPKLEIGKSDVIFQIANDNDKLGNLRVSKENIVWKPVNKQFSYWLNWNDFDRSMTENGQQGKAHL